MHILLVEDDSQLGKALRMACQQEGLDIRWEKSFGDAELALCTSGFDLILLDLGLPDGDGLDLLTGLRRRDVRTPVLVLSAREAVADRVRGLDSGADDYLPKPFAIPELLSRVKALVRRSAGFADQEWTLGNVTLRTAAHQVLMDGQTVELAPREYQLLHMLARNAGRVLTRAQLEEALAVETGGFESNALEVHIHHLRRKLRADLIRTVRGVGYMVPR